MGAGCRRWGLRGSVDLSGLESPVAKFLGQEMRDP